MPRTAKLRPVKPRAAEPEPAENIRLTADRLLVRMPDETERRSKAGLVIPATAAPHAKRCVWSEVVLTGPESRNLKAGDRVLFGKWSGTEVKLDGEELLIMKESDIMGVVA